MNDWRNVNYLIHGTAVQKEVYNLLTELEIMNLLTDYNPLLVGTIPLGIQVEDSDLDIICEVYDPVKFKSLVVRFFGAMEGFVSESRVVQGIPRTKINFMAKGWPIELFGQPRRTELQNGYLHMIVEAEILAQMDDDFRERIILLKTSGWKTEPAFAKVLGLKGDPYEALLELEKLSRSELYSLCHSIQARE
ncbi:DUF4269 domain-containing protein [Paenibacillus pseudetheri]|uniref:DUF4269 domain-containing protein n=1 Tax=Paenibacillus pseudetheri TaxID=2897682 RepID=A0ABN8FBG2_9BACL|nr:DUF4269 domain-containing protein [Paenibacillus pseudetheri]CAH1055311.1 hypothetical protein PAECIP111894_01463 [Paenibacillus pseudetheri]